MENEILKPTVCPNVLVKHDDRMKVWMWKLIYQQ